MLGRVFLLLCVVVVTGLAGDFAADTVGGELSFTVAGACDTVQTAYKYPLNRVFS